MKIAPEPEDNPSGCPCGSPIDLTIEDAQEHNLRILSCCFQEDDHSKSWIIPAQDRLPLLFFRRVFTRLRSQYESQIAQPEGGQVEEDACDPAIPIEAFQRAFERLFCVLGYEDGFDSRSYDFYDQNSDGFVGWTEFAYIFKKHSFIIKLSLPERIYLTLDYPDSSYIAQCTSTFVLAVIVLSSLSFILSTSPNFQTEPQGSAKPEPQQSLLIIEDICLTIFLIEYLLRLFTCWSIRPEVVDMDKLLDLTVGHGPLILSTRLIRFFRFIFSFSGIVDLVAILPGVIGWMVPDSLEGGGFVVLRLVRLTRIFRAFKNPKLVEPVIVIARTMSNSTKALYLLAFNGFLGILISGSLMYLAEKGKWDASTRTFKRKVGRVWNTTTESWADKTAESPFYSIPHAFWWAVVTSTTVGFGDVYPTTSWGYVVATLTMIFSLIIGALPVGVIGGNFTQVWDDFNHEKARMVAQTEDDRRFITVAMQRIDPVQMRRLLYIEVWNERFPDWNEHFSDCQSSRQRRPHLAEFMGQANLKLRLDCGSYPITETLELKDVAEGGLGKRVVTGTITVQYEWISEMEESEKLNGLSTPQSRSPVARPETASLAVTCHGRLKITLLHADGLANFSYARARRCGSNPYCMVFCYPHSPSEDSMLCPAGWRSPFVVGTTSPRWNYVCCFDFSWRHFKIASRSTDQSQDMQRAIQILHERSDGMFARADHCRGNQVSQLVRELGRELKALREELGGLRSRVVRFSSTPEPSAERMD